MRKNNPDTSNTFSLLTKDLEIDGNSFQIEDQNKNKKPFGEGGFAQVVRQAIKNSALIRAASQDDSSSTNKAFEQIQENAAEKKISLYTISKNKITSPLTRQKTRGNSVRKIYIDVLLLQIFVDKDIQAKAKEVRTERLRSYLSKFHEHK